MQTPMTRIHLTQFLCENRHCILAASWESDSTTEEEVEAALREKCAALKIHPWCGICGSTKLHVEHGITRFRSMDEALPHLSATEEANLQTMKYLHRQPKTN